MTTKLYWDDPALTNFQAQILATQNLDGRLALVLDRTAFYPLGGGQPSDIGQIEAAQVLDVITAEDGTILHRLTDSANFQVGQQVTCQVDVAYRREMTQQHTGQHILSQAFVQMLGAETRGFRINSTGAEIDLALDAAAEQIPAALRQVEDFANLIVFENRPIRTHLVSPEEAALLPLRKESFITDCVRVVEIENFDWSACGGTHARQTGQVGLIVIKNWQRAKKMVRIEFLCGVRALRDYHLANATAEAVARKFSVAREQAGEAVERMLETNKQLTRRTRQLAEVTAESEAASLLATAATPQGMPVLTKIFDDRSLEELKLLVHQLVKTPAVVVLFALCEGKSLRLIFARGANVQADMGILMREACLALNGKGGGTADFAQGGSNESDNAENVITAISQKLRSL
ncbi:MAG: DHHA1 domain-containing protein [Blastocatellia bacterium]